MVVSAPVVKPAGFPPAALENKLMEPLNTPILDCLEKGISFATATIMTHSGSTPRTSGSKMVVLKNRTIYGTIGGGLVEAMTIDACLSMIEKNQCVIKKFTLNQELKDGLDMVCGGDLTVLIEPFVAGTEPDPDMVSIFKTLADLEKQGKKAFLVSKVEGFSKSEFTLGKCLVFPDGTVVGSNLVPKSLFDQIADNRFRSSFPVIYNHGLEEFIVEPVHTMDTLYIFGAGHVGFQLAKAAHIVDFQTVIVDDRDEFANQERFPHAREVHVVEAFETAFQQLAVDEQSYIVILTRGHLHDQTVLEQALKTQAAYIGMIGSRPKRNKIYTNLKKQGISQETLDKVFSPIGLEINSETPGEIAVSIIGQIIQERGRK